MVLSRCLTTRKGIIVGLCLTTISGGVAFAEEQIFDFDIPEQRADDALILLGKQADATVLFQYDMATEHNANRLQGEYTLPQAVDVLLANSGLKAEFGEQGHLYISIDDGQGREQMSQLNDDKKKKAGFAAFLAGIFSVSGHAQEPVNTDDEAEQAFEEIIVTGSHIRGAEPVGSQLITIDRQEIDRSGYATMQQVIQSLPQNFKGGVNEDNQGAQNAGNITQGASINLRGLGSSGTLTLINGRRMPVAGIGTNFFDISTIPTSAVERVEVLPDGASAVYGSDAIAGVVNIVLRDDFDGAETQLRYGDVGTGSSAQMRFAQTFGKNWGTGNALISYEYYKRDHLANEDRVFLASNNFTRFGGDDLSSPRSNPGNILSPPPRVPTYAIPSGQDGTSLTPADLLLIATNGANVGNLKEGGWVIGDQERNSVFGTLSQELGDRVKVFVEGRYFDREFAQRGQPSSQTLRVPSSNPFFVDPFGGQSQIRVEYSFLDDFGNTVGVGDQTGSSIIFGGNIDIGRDWAIEVYGSHSKEEGFEDTLNVTDLAAVSLALADPDPATAFNPFGDGSNTNPATLEAIRRTGQGKETISRVQSANFVADGSLFHLPGGDVKLAVGANYRKETFEKIELIVGVQNGSRFMREVDSVFGELNFPIFGEGNSRPGLKNLVLSAAVRHESYSGISNASTTDPKYGLVWSPIDSLRFRGSWGTSFRAPSLSDLNETLNFSFLIGLPDPDFGNVTNSLVVTGGNADLKNETATTWSAGVDITPTGIPGFEVNLTLFDIDFENRVAPAPNGFFLLAEESLFPHRIIREPTQTQLDELCAAPGFDSDPADCTEGVVNAVVNWGVDNETKTKVRGLDFAFSYGFDTDKAGRFDFGLSGSYIMDFDVAFAPTVPLVETVGLVGRPTDFRLRGSLGWNNKNGWAGSIFINHTDSYTDNTSNPMRKIDSWTTFDLTIVYDTEDNLRKFGLNDTRFALSVLNLFDEDPPFVNQTGRGYDPTNADPLGQFLSFNIIKNW